MGLFSILVIKREARVQAWAPFVKWNDSGAGGKGNDEASMFAEDKPEVCNSLPSTLPNFRFFNFM